MNRPIIRNNYRTVAAYSWYDPVGRLHELAYPPLRLASPYDVFYTGYDAASNRLWMSE